MITSKTGTYFESKARRQGFLENGQEAKINELYAVRADSFTECETRMSSYVSEIAQGEFNILTEQIAKYSEIFFSDKDDEDIFYRVNVAFITLDERSGKEKKTRVSYLVQANSVQTAKNNVDEVMSQSMVDYKITSVVETNIVDVIDAETQEE